MKTKTKITIVSILTLLLGLMAFLLFLYPDAPLDDHSDLIPTLQGVPQAENAYFLVEQAREEFEPTTIDPLEMILYLSDQPTQVQIQDSDIETFLASEQTTITLLEKANELPVYEDPLVNDLRALTNVNTLPKRDPIITLLYNTLYVKGLFEFKKGQTEQSVITIKNAITFIAKKRKGALSLIDYLVDHSALIRGKKILNYFATKSAISDQEIESFLQTVRDTDRLDYINAIKFEFQVQTNTLEEFISGKNIIGVNRFNFQKNATLNTMADHDRKLITEAKNLFCDSTIPTITDSPAPDWTSYLKQNGIGQVFLNMFAYPSPTRLFCTAENQL